MTMRSVLRVTFLTLAMLGLTPWTAHAETITFTHTGASGSGSIGGNAFSNRAFTITATGDTLNRQSFGTGFFIDHDTASIDIDGVGVFTFLTGTRTFVNNDVEIVGFSRAGSGGSDLYNGPVNAVFGSWDMLSSIGPINGSIGLLQWGSGDINTSGGTLIFDNGTTTGFFQAEVGETAVPAPPALVMAGIGILGLFGFKLRRRVPALARA